MKCAVQTKELKTALTAVVRAIDARSPMPILRYVYLGAQDGKLHVRATDADTWALAQVDATVDVPGAICAPAKALAGVLAAYKDDSLMIEAIETTPKGSLTIGDSQLQCADAADFPARPPFPPLDTFASVDTAALARMVDLTLPCVSKDASRPSLSGVLFETEGHTTRMVATDGHRMSIASHANQLPAPPKDGTILPAETLAVWRKSLKRNSDSYTGMAFHDGKVWLRTRYSDITFAGRLVDETFLNYRGVLPSDYTHRITVDRAILSQAVAKVSVIVKGALPPAVSLSMRGDTLSLTCKNPDLGKSTATLPMSGYEGDKFEIGFNANYLQTALAGMITSAVTLACKDALAPCLFTGDGDPDYLAVIMPMRM